VKSLETVRQHRAVDFLQHVQPHLDAIVGTDAEDVGSCFALSSPDAADGGIGECGRELANASCDQTDGALLAQGYWAFRLFSPIRGEKPIQRPFVDSGLASGSFAPVSLDPVAKPQSALRRWVPSGRTKHLRDNSGGIRIPAIARRRPRKRWKHRS
jgi:hypothetical protein